METRVPPRLTEDQVNILKKSFRSLNGHQLAARFYNKLFSKYPEFRQLFSVDMNEQLAKIVSVIELVVFSFEKKEDGKYGLQDNVILPFRDLGNKHSQKGVSTDQYPIANQFLLEAIQEEAGGLLDATGISAWNLALEHLTFAMLNQQVNSNITANKTIRDSFNFIKKLIS